MGNSLPKSWAIVTPLGGLPAGAGSRPGALLAAGFPRATPSSHNPALHAPQFLPLIETARSFPVEPKIPVRTYSAMLLQVHDQRAGLPLFFGLYIPSVGFPDNFQRGSPLPRKCELFRKLEAESD